MVYFVLSWIITTWSLSWGSVIHYYNYLIGFNFNGWYDSLVYKICSNSFNEKAYKGCDLSRGNPSMVRAPFDAASSEINFTNPWLYNLNNFKTLSSLW